MSHPRRSYEPGRRRSPVLLEAVRVVFEPDPDPDVSYLKQSEFKERRMAHKRGDWNLVGVHVEADVTIHETAQTLKSGYLWGIESDSEQEYLDEIIAREWSSLRDVLKTVGVPTEELPLEVDRAWIEYSTPQKRRRE